MSEDIKAGETRMVFPPEGTNSARVSGVKVQASGTPMTINQSLLTLHENGMVRIGEVSDQQAQTAQPVQAPEQPQEAVQQPQAPQQPQPSEPPQQPPEQPAQATAEPQGQPADQALPTSDDIDRMTDVQLKDFLESVGHETAGRKRQFLVRTAKAYIENVGK